MRVFLVAGLTAFAMLLAPLAKAQQPAEQRPCFNFTDEVSPEQRVSACTAVI
jgi:hypothetical protein